MSCDCWQRSPRASRWRAIRAARGFTGDYTPTDTSVPNYDVSRDGRFLMLQPSAKDRAAPTQIIVVLNWLEELKQRVPTR
jgi:hypothetical protein